MRSLPILCLFLTLPLLGVGCNGIGTNGAAPISKIVTDNNNSETSLPLDVRNEVLEKKELCAKYLKQAQEIVAEYNTTFSGENDLGNGKHSTGNSTLEKTCFSKMNSSCFALITERDRVYPNGYQSETFVTVDLLSGERTNISKTIFADDNSGTTTEKMMAFSTAKDRLLESVDCLY
jgi:hypothetical protein